MARLDEWLTATVQKNASDLHLSSDVGISMRIDGDLRRVGAKPVPAKELQEIIFEILNEDERRKFLENKNLDKSYHVDGVGNFRANIFTTRRGIAAVFRTIPENIPLPEEIGMPESVVKVTEAGSGLVLVTGPTGSGKSTTLAALINHLNHNEEFHILTVEDPIEFVHQNHKSLINQREIGAHCATFSDALKYALREDPDVILVGELRDLETIALAMTAAETGHLVFGTLHTRGAGSSVDRIIDSFPSNQQAMIRTMLSESLKAVVSQALLKRATGKGRVAAYEIMITNHAISNLIREGKTFQINSTMQTARKEGMILMDQYIMQLVSDGVVSPFEAEGYLVDPTLVESKKSQWASSAEGASVSGIYSSGGMGNASAAKTLKKQTSGTGGFNTKATAGSSLPGSGGIASVAKPLTQTAGAPSIPGRPPGVPSMPGKPPGVPSMPARVPGAPKAAPMARPTGIPTPPASPRGNSIAKPPAAPMPPGIGTPKAKPPAAPLPPGAPQSAPIAKPPAAPMPPGAPQSVPIAKPPAAPMPPGVPQSAPIAKPPAAPTPLVQEINPPAPTVPQVEQVNEVSEEMEIIAGEPSHSEANYESNREGAEQSDFGFDIGEESEGLPDLESILPKKKVS